MASYTMAVSPGNASTNVSVVGLTTCLTDNATNTTTCHAVDDDEEGINAVEIVVVVLLSLFILAVIIGNTMVVLSVALFREMRTLSNGLIVSLASADILVAVIVLPISLYQEVVGRWTLGAALCDFWITSDVFCCTASILNIVAIAVDRYWLITKNVRYTHSTSFPRRSVCWVMLSLAWSTSALISSLPLLGWRTGKEKDDASMCLISQDLGYTIFSTFGAFWLPLIVILVVYFKIFKIARRRARSRIKQRAVHPSHNSTALVELNGNHKTNVLRLNQGGRLSDTSVPHTDGPSVGCEPGVTMTEVQPSCVEQPEPPKINNGSRKRRFRMRSYRRRTRSSARTLGLIIGGFVFCWLPFFIPATLMPLVPGMRVPPLCMSIVLWLGYSNSLLNPAIYAIWDKNFRRSFKRLATCDIRWSNVLI